MNGKSWAHAGGCREAAAVAFAVFALGGCHDSAAPVEPKAAVAAKSPADNPPAGEVDKKSLAESVLTPEQIGKLGLETATLKPIEFADEAAGYGSVIPHEGIAQAAAELATAEATERQSRAALQRTRRLSGTAGALSADAEEISARQAAVDAAALTLARQRLAATFGQTPPWSSNPALLSSLAGGSTQLVRVTFPLGALSAAAPKSLRAARIGATSERSWTMSTIWAAPADANVPGRSFFALLRDSGAGEGERIVVWAPLGEPQAGVVIPRAAVVISDGKYWCYLEKKPGTFARTQIETRKPYSDGYFVNAGIKAGDTVVTQGAAQLLAQESNSGADAD
jgi:hypothetical protein